jgi:alcohol dehydrogenase (cytochrome c)
VATHARRGSLALAALAALACAAGAAAGDWPQPNGDLRGTRAVEATRISSASVAGLRLRWRFRLPSGSPFGSFASTPLVVGDTVYVQDLSSSVYALDARTGRRRWTLRLRAPNDGPNGLAAAAGRLFGATDTSVFALDPRTGRRLWGRRLTSASEQFVDIAPLAARGLVFASTVGFPPGGRGALYALDQRNGRIRWRFDTIREPWRYPSAGGGGAWFTPSLAGDGRLYVGTANPGPWGGSPLRPNGGMYPGPVPYTDSLLGLRARTGVLVWHGQVTRHDVRDYDFEATPIVVGRAVYGAGKAGRVAAWDRLSGRRLWARAVGTHLHDLGPLPRRPTTVCPGLWGGVLTPMAYARGRLLVPVVELCMRESAIRPMPLRNAAEGDGVLVALAARSGRQLWTRRLGAPPMGCATAARDVVFVPTYDGRVLALAARDGRSLWQARARAGIIGCPAVAGDMLVVGAGAPHPAYRPRVPEVLADRLPAARP